MSRQEHSSEHQQPTDSLPTRLREAFLFTLEDIKARVREIFGESGSIEKSGPVSESEKKRKMYDNSGISYNYALWKKSDQYVEEYFSVPFMQKFRKELAQLPAGSKLLDLGSGVGLESRIFRQMFPNIEVISVDLSDYGVKQGAGLGLNQVQALAEEIPFAQGTFNAIHTKDLLVHISDKPKFFDNVAKSLVLGGILYIITAQAKPSKSQYSWDFESIVEEAKKHGLKLESHELVAFEHDDWYVNLVKTKRLILRFRKILQ